MAAKSTVARLMRDIAIPAAVMVCLAILPIANYKFGVGLMPHGLIYLIIRVLVVASAGFLVTYRTRLGLPAAAGVGAIMFFVEQLTVALWFMVDGQPQSVIGIARSFALLVAVAAIVGALGGLAGKAWSNRERAAI